MNFHMVILNFAPSGSKNVIDKSKLTDSGCVLHPLATALGAATAAVPSEVRKVYDCLRPSDKWKESLREAMPRAGGVASKKRVTSCRKAIGLPHIRRRSRVRGCGEPHSRKHDFHVMIQLDV